ncbi:conserved hypothetical protein [Vibrio nigripulchritudo SFn27]|uniref:Uncharacterized protein n=2 Tax=Vibrio nigripulchritudo TaxID=28173 RepID=U4K6C3_9VIBR|nr:hypothetical protein [Vibrio nigripulchritudo]KJY80938.1 hypothetical protein TW74_01165 [Vibrio nigripulchritudo]CCN70614.1 conserved hypothetical protein [Vibrio nigripulchritudo SFn118]CCN82575.1 conserved hypothetical protein [Vibrio nigripulchritudo BLFn1]CCN89725.1 conserved hypothetical protein [Vibrio nigripulchritudo SFn27]CCN92122.1 conserved hypothetical protein [Vibrio nigripulchritudo ENn2]
MAVSPKHNDIGKHYNPDQDFSNDQRHRFTEIANRAAERRAQKNAVGSNAASNKQPQPKAKTHKRKKTFFSGLVRAAIWSAVLGLTWLWVIFMTGGY